MTIRNKTDFIVVHCSATPPKMDIGADIIRQWHTTPKPKGNGWQDIGYHYVIRRDGRIETGRPVDQIGSHVYGYNSRSVGVCMVGGVNDLMRPENNFTDKQWQSLVQVLVILHGDYPTAKIVGHCQLDPKKACPSFDVPAWLKATGGLA